MITELRQAPRWWVCPQTPPSRSLCWWERGCQGQTPAPSVQVVPDLAKRSVSSVCSGACFRLRRGFFPGYRVDAVAESELGSVWQRRGFAKPHSSLDFALC